MQKKTLRLVLGDQLNIKHSWWSDDPATFTVLMAETLSETGYVRHHIQKVTAFYLAMRHFAEALQAKGIEVVYLKLDDPKNKQSFSENIKSLLEHGSYTHWAYLLPDEYRLDEELKALANKLDLPCDVADTEHFLSERGDLAAHFKGKKTFVMESFYRMMRKKYDILMDGSEPVQGNWNFDKENRKSLPDDLRIPTPKTFPRKVKEVTDLLEKMDVKTIGRIDPEAFIWPLTREESLEMLGFFAEKLLNDFGNFQDAMKKGEWSLYHARLSFGLNSKLIDPLEVIREVEDRWRADPKGVPLAAVEGFIRQILGWREYMRGVYWAKMPEYASLNYFGHSRKLPSWFWTGETKMQCLSQAVNQSLDYAYAHHIQRLMVTGNFALLAGIDPDEVDAWYLGVYIDAIEWVEITNTRGMSQYADGGLVGTKPYVSSANYIDKMSDYCQGCHYDKKKKVGDKACPFNSLYWNFYERHRDKLEDNPRIGFVYPTLNKMKGETRAEILEQAQKYLKNLETL
jgi:deoxyribodipyrimidine photolyase-related protein